MLHGLFNLRANALIVFAGAFLVIFLIKASAYLLPAQYYFSFSKLVAGDRGPFLVDPPSVSGQKMCGLLKKYRVSASDIQASQVNCSLGKLEGKVQASGPGKGNFTNDQIDFIYRTVLASDRAVLAGGGKLLRDFKFTPMADDEINKLIEGKSSLPTLKRSIADHYVKQLNRKLTDPIASYTRKRFEAYQETSTPESGPGQSGVSFEPLNPSEQAKLKETVVALSDQLNEKLAQLKLASIGKSDVDGIVDSSYGKWDVMSSISGFYGKQAETWARKEIATAFARSGLEIPDTEKAKQAIFTELLNEGLDDYIISVALRIAPVLLFGLVLGFLFGPREFLSIGLAAGLAAFLLSWPLLLLWDRLVGYNWQDQKQMFLIFYVIYAVSFFVTARFAAVFGAFVRELFSRKPTYLGSDASHVVEKAVGWRDLAFNLVTGLAVNGVVYAWNVIIPLTAS